MDYKGLLSDLEFIDLKSHLAAIEGRVGRDIKTSEFVEFVRELAAFHRLVTRRING